MKLLGLTCGKKMGNSEIVLKEALMGAEEVGGVTTEIIRLHNLDIKPCKGCGACFEKGAKEGTMNCVQKDDFPFFKEKLYDCDAIIISSPVYIMSPTGAFRVLCDRCGPFLDVVMLEAFHQMAGENSKVDMRAFKPRVAGFLSVGGASSPDWVSMGIDLMNLFTMSAMIKVVDTLQVTGAAEPGAVLLQEETMKRARQLGRNVARAAGKPEDKREFMGDDPGVCPLCHSNLMVLEKDSKKVMCAICGIDGEIRTEGDKTTVHFLEESFNKSRVTMEGHRVHFREITAVATEFQRRKKEVIPKMEKYKNWGTVIKPSRGDAE